MDASGGIWAPGGGPSEGRSLFAATGNTFFVKEWSDGEAVLGFAPDLARPVGDAGTLSHQRTGGSSTLMISISAERRPFPLDDPSARAVRKLILAIGKDGYAYLLDRDNLGGIGGELANSSDVAPAPRRRRPSGAQDDAVLVALRTDGANCPPDKPGRGLVVLKIRADPAPAIDTAWCGNVASVQRRADRHHEPTAAQSDRVRPRGLRATPTLAFRGDTGELLVSARDRVSRHQGLRDPDRRRRQALSPAAGGSTPSRFRAGRVFTATERRGRLKVRSEAAPS